MNMDNKSTTCQVCVSWRRDVDPHLPNEYAIFSMKDVKASPDVTAELRQKWAKETFEIFSSDPPDEKKFPTIRPWNILLHQDGSVKTLPSEKKNGSFYPSRFRIPPETILGFDEGEKVKRAEKFALGSLIYEIMTGTAPFDELGDNNDGEVQDRYSRGIFPDDVFAMPMGPFILGCWSLEFETEMVKLLAPPPLSVGDRIRAYPKHHPYLFAAQIVGGVVATASLAVPLALGAAGFAATGPAALSVAAAWQSSIGVVQAGSLFAWCQSVAMGGAAVNGIMAASAVGAGVAGAATAGGVMMDGGQKKGAVVTPEELKERFLAVYRKGNGQGQGQGGGRKLRKERAEL